MPLLAVRGTSGETKASSSIPQAVRRFRRILVRLRQAKEGFATNRGVDTPHRRKAKSDKVRRSREEQRQSAREAKSIANDRMRTQSKDRCC